MAPQTTPTTLSLSTQKADVIAEFQALIDGINSLLTGIDPFILLGKSVSRAEVLAKLQARIDTATKTKNDRKLVSVDVAAERAAAAAANPIRKGLKAFAISQFGDTSPLLQQLGFVPHRTPKRKPAKVAAGTEKGTATREAVGPTGKQKRAAKKAAAATATPAEAPAQTPVTGAPHAPAGGGSNQGSSS